AVLAREVYTDMLPMARQFGTDLRIDASTPCVTLIDADRFRQALRIVLDNALKYTPAGRDVRLTVTHDTNYIRVVVQDTGEGIPSEHLPRLFDRFYRVDQSRSRAAGGTGLGLPIARALVEAQGGSIDLTSIVGQGTTVMISLPSPGNAQRSAAAKGPD
ncbi:MAG TPA: ATP-binding protein, partial [Nitrolancea sp.]